VAAIRGINQAALGLGINVEKERRGDRMEKFLWWGRINKFGQRCLVKSTLGKVCQRLSYLILSYLILSFCLALPGLI
jgi:hypothetical protein